MIHSDLLVSLVAALVAAFIGGFIAARLRLPPIAGYLVAGIVIGPSTPGFDADPDIAAELAEIGVVLLMFGVGIHFSLRELWAVRTIAVPGAIFQIACATALGIGVTMAFGWTFGEALVLGLAISVASTVVLLRALEDRGTVDSTEGHAAVGWLIVEDFFTVLVLVLLPSLAVTLGGESSSSGDDALLGIAEALAKAGVFVVAMLVAGSRLIPRLLAEVARTGSRELFTLSVLATALGVAAGSAELFGVSLALGAFLAGVIISESDLSHKAAAEALPMRDAFAVLFFVSVGMLFDPGALTDSYKEILALLGVVLLGKATAAYLIVALLGYSVRVGLVIAAALAQIGEFSFILMTVGTDLKIVSQEHTDIVLAVALISIIANPLVFGLVGPLEGWLRTRAPAAAVGRRQVNHPLPADGDAPLRNHAIICGFGRVGSVVASAIEHRNFRYVVVEENRRIVDSLRARGVPVVYGDAGHHLILARTHVEHARVLVVTVPHPPTARRIVGLARQINPRLDVIVRTHSARESSALELAGAGESVFAEWEVALELTRRALYRFGLSSREALTAVQRLRSRGPPRSIDDPLL